VGAPSSFGAAGGGAGSGGEVVLSLADGKRIQAPKYGVERHGPGTYRALSPGGGGYGDPRTRDPARVLRDVRDGVVSRASAERDYAVAIAADWRSIDEARTATLRAQPA
jgi:N-methylhydantoinase B